MKACIQMMSRFHRLVLKTGPQSRPGKEIIQIKQVELPMG